MRHAPVALLLSLPLAALACAPAPAPARPPVTAPTPAPSASASTPPHPRRAPNVEALEAALTADGYTARLSASRNGHVAVINFRAKTPTTLLPHQLFVAVMKEHGELLGYGALGEPDLGGSSGLSGPVGSMVGNFPHATACPHLRFEAAFEELDDSHRAPVMWSFACPDSEPEMAFFQQVHGVIQMLSDGRRAPVAVVVDPLDTWLRSQGVDVEKVSRDAGRVNARISSAVPPNGDRLATVKAFAEKVARFEKLPALDTTDLTPYAADEKDPRSLPTKFRALTLRLAKPPLDGACIDPRITINLFDSAAAPPSTPASARMTDITVVCAKEPADGAKAPDATGRALPRAASGALAFVAVCESTSFAWGYVHSGRVIDKRGDVYTFSGGPVFSGKSAHELAVLLRHGKRYLGTLPPADVDRLIALAAQVEHEPFQEKAVTAYDAPSGGCSLLRAGASADALVPIRFDEVGTKIGKRVGPAASEAEKLLEKAASIGAPR